MIGIGIICVAPEFEFFSKSRKKYNKTKKWLEYDVKLNYQNFKLAKETEVKQIVATAIINSLNILDEFNISDFDVELLKADLEKFFRERSYFEE